MKEQLKQLSAQDEVDRWPGSQKEWGDAQGRNAAALARKRAEVKAAQLEEANDTGGRLAHEGRRLTHYT